MTPTPTEAIEPYRLMVRIRRFEEKLDQLFKEGALPGFVHLYIGEEAVAVGVCSQLRADDRITSTHRGHGHLIAKGADPGRMMAELLGKATGYCHGKGGSMHIVDFDLGIIGTNGIVGAGIPIATGSAWGDAFLGRDSVSVAFFGDGAANQGVLMEALNLAAVWRLPVIFVCENNGYAEWTPVDALTAGPIHERGRSMGVPGVQVDGNDLVAVGEAVATAVQRARRGEGPTLIEAVTYRWSGHNLGEEAFAGNYRPREEQDRWHALDPIPRYREHLVTALGVDPAELDRVDTEEASRIDEATEFAKRSPSPEAHEAFEGLFAEAAPSRGREQHQEQSA